MEIERKWVLSAMPEGVEFSSGKYIVQSYFFDDCGTSGRIREVQQEDNQAFLLTMKDATDNDLAREEIEVAIPEALYYAIKAHAIYEPIQKTRRIAFLDDGNLAEVDEYYLHLAPLVTVEMEFFSLSEAESFVAPDWFGREVTGDPRYLNSEMARTGIRPPLHP